MSSTRKTAETVKDQANDAAQAARQTADAASATVNDGVDRMTQGMSQMGSFGQEAVEAMMASASTLAKGFERIGQENMTFAKSQMETAAERAQAFAKVRSPQEFFEAQADYVRGAMEAQIEQANKVSDMMITATRDAAQPLSKRYSAMVEMMQPR